MEAKAARLSRVEMTEMVLPSHTNPLNTVFGGVIMSWVDIASAISAQRHARSHVVTASIDAMHFLAPASLGDNVVLLAQVNNAWQTSMEIEVIVQAEERGHVVTPREDIA